MSRVEQWATIKLESGVCLTGYVYDDARANGRFGAFVDGHRIITTPIVSLDKENKTAQTANTLYHLGEPLDAPEELTPSNYDKYLPSKAI